MREGQNPVKMQNVTVEPPAAVTVCVLNYIPEQTGYFAGVLDALKLCLASLRANADQPFDLIVFDNGSCAAVRDYLARETEAGRIDLLMQSHRNLGKGNAVLQMLNAAQGDAVFYTDGDVFFRPGWLGAHLEVLQAFPQAGIVGGSPFRHLANYCTAATLQWVEQHQDDLQIERGDLIPEAWIQDFIISFGHTNPDKIAQWKQNQDCRITNAQGVTAYVGTWHNAYVMPKTLIKQLPNKRFNFGIDSKATPEGHFIDEYVDEQGYLRLSTAQPYVYHIGNKINEAWLVEAYERLVKPHEQGQGIMGWLRRAMKLA